MQIQGTIEISVDCVAIQQAEIASQAIFRGLPIVAKAGMAARHQEDFITFFRICKKHGYQLEYSYANQDEKVKGTWHVTFKIRPMTREEMARAA